LGYPTLTLEEKVGQMFTFGNRGPEITEESRELIARRKAGGIFLGGNCLDNPEQVFQLTSALQREALATENGIPLFVSADFVAGTGCKLKRGGTHFPKNFALGAAGDERLAYESGRITALESLAIGVNFNYSPVVDINNNPANPVIGTHSFGEDAELVSRLGSAVIRGYQEHGLIATAKHFPGHGNTSVDSHEALPVLTFRPDQLEAFELVPFRRAIEAGVDAIMVGHIAVPELDPSRRPASLSYPLTTGLLRNRLGFRGLIVTDGLSMKGVTNAFSIEEACVEAVLAGADILLATTDSYEQSLSVLDAVIRAVRTGRISERRIDESVERILAVKRKYGLMAERVRKRSFDAEPLQRPEHREIALEAGRKAVTPLHGPFPPLVSGTHGERPWKLIRDEKTAHFADLMMKSAAIAEQRVIAVPEELPTLPELLRGESGNLLVAISHNKPLPTDWLDSVRDAIRRRDGRVVWVHFGSPYDASRLNEVPLLLMYDHARPLQEAAAEWLLRSKPERNGDGA
jgi:beta-N-acetylhexosaminidase